MACEICLRRFKILPDTKYTLRILPKDFYNFAKVTKYRQIWSLWLQVCWPYPRVNPSTRSSQAPSVVTTSTTRSYCADSTESHTQATRTTYVAPCALKQLAHIMQRIYDKSAQTTAPLLSILQHTYIERKRVWQREVAYTQRERVIWSTTKMEREKRAEIKCGVLDWDRYIGT